MTEQERIAEFRRLEASINPLDLREYLLCLLYTSDAADD